MTSNAENQLEKAVHKKILLCMPTPSVAMGFKQSLQKFDDFANSQMGKMISRGSQAEVSTCRAVVEKLRTGTYTPDAALANAGGVYGKFYELLQCFCRAPKSSTDAVSMLYLLCFYFQPLLFYHIYLLILVLFL